jgi:hypothetical protein
VHVSVGTPDIYVPSSLRDLSLSLEIDAPNQTRENEQFYLDEFGRVSYGATEPMMTSPTVTDESGASSYGFGIICGSAVPQPHGKDGRVEIDESSGKDYFRGM